MDFFGRQEQARRHTARLLLLFALGVIGIIAAVDGAVWLIWLLMERHPTDIQVVPVTLFFWSSLLTLLAIAVGSSARIMQLAQGGKAVADMVAARRIAPETTDTLERRLINVVEEMALASGMPVPRLYVMDNESGINAFVAGWKTQEAVLVVTRGALQQLNRSELQGVIGHEFSHILNGDMRLNIRLLGALAGILLIGQCGQFLLRSLRYVDDGPSCRRRDGGGMVVAILLLAVALIAIGYIGLLVGRLIKAAISRQREFLADASSVQYTRDNTAIAGALAKIELANQHALLQTPHAEEMSHMCFASPLNFSALMATHPSIKERLQALGLTPELVLRRTANAGQQAAPIPAAEVADTKATKTGNTSAGTGGEILASIGQLSPLQLQRAAQQQSALPVVLLESAHDRLQVPELIIALLLTETPDRAIIEIPLQQRFGELRLQAIEGHERRVKALPINDRMLVLNNARTALEMLGNAQRQSLMDDLHFITRLDAHITPFEYVLTALLGHWLLPPPERPVARITRFDAVAHELAEVVGVMVCASRQSLDVMESQFAQAMSSFGLPKAVLRTTFDAGRLRLALETLDNLAPLLKRPLLNTLLELALADAQLRSEESEMLRAIAAQLNCPLPPQALAVR